MLHVLPQRRPTAVQLLKHVWITQQTIVNQQIIDNSHYIQSRKSEHQLKETVANTYKAIAGSPKVAHLGPVVMSELARRRFKDKASEKLQYNQDT